MIIIYSLIAVYLLIGLIYTIYQYATSLEPIKNVFLNILVSPILLPDILYNSYKFAKLKRVGVDDLLQNKKAVILTLDQTLLDMFPAINKCIIDAALTIDTYIFTNELPKGLTIERTWEYIFNKYTPNTLKSPSQMVEYTERSFYKYYDEISYPQNLIFELDSFREQNIKVGLVSSFNREITEKILLRLGLSGAFDVQVTKEDVDSNFPESDLLKTAVEKLECNLSEVLGVSGDRLAILAFEKAKIDVVVYSSDSIDTDEYFTKHPVVSSIEDLYDVLANTDRKEFNYFMKNPEEAKKLISQYEAL